MKKKREHFDSFHFEWWHSYISEKNPTEMHSWILPQFSFLIKHILKSSFHIKQTHTQKQYAILKCIKLDASKNQCSFYDYSNQITIFIVIDLNLNFIGSSDENKEKNRNKFTVQFFVGSWKKKQVFCHVNMYALTPWRRHGQACDCTDDRR